MRFRDILLSCIALVLTGLPVLALANTVTLKIDARNPGAKAAETTVRSLLPRGVTPSDILDHPQLEARSYFQELFHPELDSTLTYPGVFVKDEGGGRVGLRRRPPLIGEHNREIYCDELGLSLEQLTTLKATGAI